MIFSKVKDIKFRNQYNKIEKIRNTNKYLITNTLSKIRYLSKSYSPIKYQQILFSIFKLNSKFKLLSKVKFVRRCILTNRNRAVNRNYNMSRSIFQKLIQFGLVPGCKKAVW